MKIKEKLKMIVVAGMMSAGVPGVMNAPVSAYACPEGSVNPSASSARECNIKKDDSLFPVVNNALNVALGLVGLAAVAVIIWGGFTYTSSTGDAQKVKKAKDTILYGIIGLVVALLAYAIVNFVLKNVFK